MGIPIPRRSGLFAVLMAFVVCFASLPALAQRNSPQQWPSYRFTISEKDSQNRQFVDVQIPSPQKKALEWYAPKQLPDFFNTSQRSLNQKTSPSRKQSTLAHTAIDFPKESAVFFAGVGGVLLMEMLTHYEKNPMALTQQVENLSNPVGHFSFFMFMYANRMSASLWPKFIKNPALWPYLGMTVGMLASDLTSQALEPLRSCAGDLFRLMRENKKGVPPSCESAYKDLVIEDQILELAPSLTSMLMSTWLAGTLQKTLVQGLRSKAFTQATKSPLVWKSINIASYLLPGKIPMAIGATALNLFQISLFVGIDHKLSPLIRKQWANVRHGIPLASLTDTLTEELLSLKSQKWQPLVKASEAEDKKCLKGEKGEQVCYDGFLARLVEFRQEMAQWRQANLEPVHMAHSSWNQKLSQLSAMYDGSFNVYNHVLNSIIASKQGKESPIDEIDPFHGIKPLLPDPQQEFPEAGYLEGYWQAQNFQKARLKTGAKLIFERLKELTEESLIEKTMKYLSLSEKGENRSLPPSVKRLESIARLWEAQEESALFLALREFRDSTENISEAQRELVGKALEVLSSEDRSSLMATPVESRTSVQEDMLLGSLRFWYDRETEKMVQGTKLLVEAVKPVLGTPQRHRAPVQEIYDAVIKEVGMPRPSLERGEAYLDHLGRHPEFKKYFELLDLPMAPGQYPLKNPGEYFVFQMICGPDAEAGSNLVKESWAGYDQFIPPQIRQTNHRVLDFCDKHWAAAPRSIYSAPLKTVGSTDRPIQYEGVFGYLKDNIRASVLDAKTMSNQLKDWWDQNTGAQLDHLFRRYGKDYSEVIHQFRDIVKNKKRDALNRSPIFNSPIAAAQQEIRFYSLVINEVLKDSLSDEYKGGDLWKPSVKTLWMNEELKNYKGSQLPLFAILRFNGPSDVRGMLRSFSSVANAQPQGSQRPSGDPDDLAILQQLDYNLTNLTQLLTATGKNDQSRRFHNEAFIAATERVEASAGQLRDLLQSEAVQGLSETQRRLIDLSMESIDSVLKELNSYRYIVSLLNRDAEGKREDNNCRTTQNRAGQMSIVCTEERN